MVGQHVSTRRKGSGRTDTAKTPKDVQLLLDFGTDERLLSERLPKAPGSSATDDPAKDFARRFAALLETDPQARFDNRDVSRLCRDVFGHAAGCGRAAYDAAEAGFNVYLERIGLDVKDPRAALDWLLAEQQRLPLQTRRDQQQIDLQQFSTPPAQALVAVTAAALSPGMTVLEPSAGTGNLAVQARLAGARVHTNEIDERRRSLLALQGFSPTAHDAERLDNLLAAERTFDAVVMNPPFSATGGRVKGHNTAFGARHVTQALLRLRPGGRLVAIVGSGMALDRPAFGRWWKDVTNRYCVRANIGVDGREYARFGTSYDNQIIVIDAIAPKPDLSGVITASGLSLAQALDVLKELASEDVAGRLRKYADKTTTPPLLARSANTNGSGRTQQASATSLQNGSPTARNGHAPIDPHTTTPNEHPNTPLAASTNGTNIGKLQPAAAPTTVDIEEGTVFAAYRVQKARIEGAVSHPANVVESTAMACVESPDVTYQHHLPADVVSEGRVSELQLEDVVYAGQATSVLLPDGSRKGHWNGDGTGIGKGREIYAFIYDQFEQGRTRHVHVSASHQLCADAERDRSALGLPLRIIHQARLKADESIDADSGVLFTTYTMLSNDFGGQQKRFSQLVRWLGSDFDGVIAFDEAHLMKNAAVAPRGAASTVDRGTLRGNMGITLQRLFPNARVRYFSATGATQARHMAAYERLGLWGAGAPFADFRTFLMAMEQGGVAAMEMLSRDLKSVGTYLSRTISYGPTRREDGTLVPDSAVEYEPLLHRLSGAEREQYDRIANLWSELLVAFESAEHNAGQGHQAHRYSQFYSAQQRFFLQLMLAYTLPDVIPAIEQDLAAGRSVVLSLFSTGEAQTERKVQRARADGLELSELDATPREMILQLVEQQFPIYQYHEVTDPVTGNVVRRRVEDEAGNPEINRENYARQQQLLDQVADLDFPQNPLDAILSHFGSENVAEISGRSHRFERGRYVRRKIQGVARRELNEHETRLFQQGEKRLAVISGAGSTGISVHADTSAPNQQRRVFYAFELSWSADQQMQAFGRVHRSNQTSAPIIRLVLVDLAGQKRLVNAVSKRLAALGALTKGERHSLSSDLFRPEDVTDTYGKAALARLYREIQSGRHHELGIGQAQLERMGVLDAEKVAVRDSYKMNVEQFLNRIMVLDVDRQNRIFELFYERYLLAVEAAKRQSAFDFGVEEIKARNLKRTTEPEVLFVDPASGARTMLHELAGEVDVERLSFAAAAQTAKNGFFRNNKSGRIYAVSPHWNTDRSELQLSAVKGVRRSVEPHELAQKYEPVEHSEAKRWWDAAYADTPATESRRYFVLSGALIPIYDKVMGSGGIYNVKIARARLTDGASLVGLNLAPADVPQVKQRLGIGTPLAEASPGEISDLVQSGSIIELDNGWRLRRAQIAGDRVVELTLNGQAANRDELTGYGLTEEIVYYKRRWFVGVDESESVLKQLLAHRRPVKDLTAQSPDTHD